MSCRPLAWLVVFGALKRASNPDITLGFTCTAEYATCCHSALLKPAIGMFERSGAERGSNNMQGCRGSPCWQLSAPDMLPQVHLELPPGGNGRSRDEWVSAFSDLAALSYKPLLTAGL